MKRSWRGLSALLLGLAVLPPLSVPHARAADLEKVTLLEPAPEDTWAFTCFILAKSKGYFANHGLEVTFQLAKGGAEVAKQVGAGNAEIGTALGDTPIIVRQNGVPIRGVMLMSGHAVHQLIMRADRGFKTLADLKGKKLAVSSFQDTTFYIGKALTASAGLQPSDVSLQGFGVSGAFQATANGTTDGMIGPPEMGVQIQAAGVEIIDTPTDKYFPGLGQALMASDDMIAKRPEMLRKFVAATRDGIMDIMKDPDQAAEDFVKAAPNNKEKLPLLKKTLEFYAKNVYPFDGKTFGAFDRDRVAALQAFYHQQGVIQGELPVDQLFTNQFVQ